MEKKLVIWDLFGGLNGSLGLAIGYEDYDIYTIDILPKTKDGRDNIVIDLAYENYFALEEELKKLPKPDIIVASPMCNSFSRAATGAGGNASWIVEENNQLSFRPDYHYGDKTKVKRNYNVDKLIENRRLGFRAVLNTLIIIRDFKPKVWYIENPKTSLIWNLIKYNFNSLNFDFIEEVVENNTYYNNYGAPYKKPTKFLSNIDLKLKNENIKSKVSFEYLKGGKKMRSDIPQQLLKDIITRMEEYINEKE